jgi:Secretion system C-terminal sorting domain
MQKEIISKMHCRVDWPGAGISERHGFCSQVIHIYYPMKQLQLWLASAFFCCALMAQSPDERPASTAQAEINPTFSFFTVTAQNGHAVLRWSVPSVKAEDFFILEKSSDAVHFNMLSAMDANSGSDSVFSLEDNSVGVGTVSYRIRITGKDGKELCSKTVNLNSASTADFKFYPNPVDKLLIIRSSHPLSVQVTDADGLVWFGQDVEAGMQIVNVSSLQKGNYTLKATDKATNTVISEQLVKNN